MSLDNGVALAYDDVGSGTRSLVLLHGLGCDRSTMSPQVEHFSGRYRVVNVDLRGHGESDAPVGPYHPDVMGKDVALLCAALELDRPFLVGHSLGGVVGLRVAHLYPELLAGLVALDSAIAVPAAVREFTTTIVANLDALESAEYHDTLVDILGGFFSPHDDPQRRESIVNMMASCRKDVFLSGWLETVTKTDTVEPLRELAVPMLFVGAPTPTGDLEVIRAGSYVSVAQTVGSGHFIEVECPQQVNAMIDRYFHINNFS